MKKKELEAHYEELRHQILNGILVMKDLIKKLEHRCIAMEKAIKTLEENNDI